MLNLLKLKQSAIAVTSLMSVLGSFAISLPALAQLETSPKPVQPEERRGPNNGQPNPETQNLQRNPGEPRQEDNVRVGPEEGKPQVEPVRDPQPQVVESSRPVVGLW